MNQNLEIQREAIIEIVGTQYEGRAANHQPLELQKKLLLKHQRNNPHDRNAVLLLTEDGKELGFLPMGYASIYAPAIDSGRYGFAVEIVKSEPDPERPILIVKITSELKNHSEEEIEADVLRFVQNIVNGYAQRKTEFLAFVDAEQVEVEVLLSALNKARLLGRLQACAGELIESRAMQPNSAPYTPMTRDALTRCLRELKADVSDILKIIQKAYNESLDIEDEEEYHRVQGEVRERRKQFRLYDELLTAFLDTAEGFSGIRAAAAQQNAPTPEQAAPPEPLPAEAAAPAAMRTAASQLTEQAFFRWLLSEGGVSDFTAKQILVTIHSIEKLYQTLFGSKRKLLGAVTADDAKEMLEALRQRSEYQDANARRHDSFNAALEKYTQFAERAAEGVKTPPAEKRVQPAAAAEPSAVKTVDFDNLQSCTIYQPCAFTLNGIRYAVRSWRELYTNFLILLYNDIAYSDTLMQLAGQSLFGAGVDFADHAHLLSLRRPISVGKDLFAEGHLTAPDMLRYIKRLTELCGIDSAHLVIEYTAQEKAPEAALPERAPESAAVPAASAPQEQEIREVPKERVPAETPVQIPAETPAEARTAAPAAPPAAFAPDTSKPFVLKDALAEILASDAPEIAKYREHKEGISSKSLREILTAYYGKTVGLFELSKLLMLDMAFQSVGKGCYILNAAAEAEQPEEKAAPAAAVQQEEPAPPEEQPAPSPELPAETPEESPSGALTIEAVLAAMRENCGNLEYEDGFGAYEVKNLLARRGISDVSEAQIEALMAACPALRETEDGYYMLAADDAAEETAPVQMPAEEAEAPAPAPAAPQEAARGAGQIMLRLNGADVTAYDYADAFRKVCEFAVNCAPFRMARIAAEPILLHGSRVFYRRAVPVEGCRRLSNGLQVIDIAALSDLEAAAEAVKAYCRIEDGMIMVISR